MGEGHEVESVGNGTAESEETGAPRPEMNGIEVAIEETVVESDICLELKGVDCIALYHLGVHSWRNFETAKEMEYFGN